MRLTAAETLSYLGSPCFSCYLHLTALACLLTVADNDFDEGSLPVFVECALSREFLHLTLRCFVCRNVDKFITALLALINDAENMNSKKIVRHFLVCVRSRSALLCCDQSLGIVSLIVERLGEKVREQSRPLPRRRFVLHAGSSGDCACCADSGHAAAEPVEGVRRPQRSAVRQKSTRFCVVMCRPRLYLRTEGRFWRR